MHKSLVIRFLFFLVVSVCFSQTSQLDSLKYVSRTASTDSIKVRALKDISWIYLNSRSEGDLAKIYVDSVYNQSEKAGLEWGVSLAHYQYCVYERQLGNYDKALKHIEKYLNFHKTKNDQNALANGLYQKAIILDDKGSTEESLKIYYQILEIYEQQNDIYSVGTTLNSMGEILKESGKIQEALDSYNKSLSIFEKLQDKTELANVNYNLGDTYLRLIDYDKALKFFNKALAYDTEIESDWGMAYDLTSLGKVAHFKGDYNRALEYHEQALNLRKKLNQQRELVLSYIELGRTYLELKDYENGEDNLLKAFEISNTIGVKTELKDASELLVNLYSKKGEYKKALEYNKQFIAVKDSLFNEAKSQQIEELQAKFDLSKKEDEITSLEKDAEIKDLKLKRQSTLRNIIIAVTLTAILFAFFLFKRYKSQQKFKQDELIKKQLIEKAEVEKERVLELQKVDRLKDEFLANTSHELRTPLTGIIGLTESLKDGIAGDLPKAAIENLEMISSSGKRLSHLVNDILDFSKLRNGDLALNLSPVDLYAVSNIVVKLSKPLLSAKVDLFNEIPKNLSLVSADENRLQQILYNLIGNAIKFTEEGKIKISAEEVEDYIRVTIADTGLGISKEKYDDIFKPFEQGDGSIIRQKGGTGLGLTVTKQLVELHGGQINFVSEVDKGTSFMFTLKKNTAKRISLSNTKSTLGERQLQKVHDSSHNSESKNDNTPIISNYKALRLLIVDDEPINRKVLQNQLSLAGYLVKEAVDGKQALSYFKLGDTFDLVLLDIMMPGMSGYEVCEKIRSQHNASELPIILLTAKNRVSDLVYGFNIGANDYLTKPFSKNELLSRIRTHINLKTIHNATSKFIPTEFLKSIDKETITDVSLGDHTEKEVTVLFTDIRGYTKLAETMSPEQNFKFVNAYSKRMGPLIQQNRGFVNQYLGDGIMSLFPYKPYHALQAAIDMQNKITAYNKNRILEGYQPLAVGMGLHTGPLVMGIIGDAKRNDTAIIADTVNTASRMEGIAKHYGANIIVSGNSFNGIENKDQYNFRYLGKVKAKGKDEVADIYECFDGDGKEQIALKKESLMQFNEGIELFFKKEFNEAINAFTAVLECNMEDKAAYYFINKSKAYLINVPENWDGVNMMSTK